MNTLKVFPRFYCPVSSYPIPVINIVCSAIHSCAAVFINLPLVSYAKGTEATSAAVLFSFYYLFVYLYILTEYV
jgi:hypothetical protein